MKATDELCEKIALSISRGPFYAAEYSGFSALERSNIEKLLKVLVQEIKKEIHEEKLNGPA